MDISEQLEGISTTLQEECDDARRNMSADAADSHVGQSAIMLSHTIQACTDALLYGAKALVIFK